jgi:hypothetical protein
MEQLLGIDTVRKMLSNPERAFCLHLQISIKGFP